MGSGASVEATREKLEKMKAALEMENDELSKLIERTIQDLNSLTNVKLDIAIIGRSRVGKSSLVNTLRGLKDGEEGAAETGVTETTMEIKEYPHPTFSNVTLWDLPGVGSPELQSKDYLQVVDLTKYDFFIIVASSCSTDIWLAQEIHKTGKQFYYVRTKLDADIRAERMRQNFNEEKILERIREFYCGNLAKAGESHPRVFLISNHDWNRYDFQFLLEALGNELNEIKRYALITAFLNHSKEILKKKKAAMEACVEDAAVMASASGAVSDPDLIVCNISFLEEIMKDFGAAFGLDEDSLLRLAKQVSKPVPVLSSAIKKTRITSQINNEFVKSLLRRMCKYRTRASCDFILCHTLQRFLDDAEEDAADILAKAFEN